MKASTKKFFSSDRQKNIRFLVGVFVLLSVSILLLVFVLGPGGSGGWLNTDVYTENAKQIGVVLPTLNTVYYKDIYETLLSEATYYNWEFSVAASDVNGGILEAAEELIGRSVELMIIVPECNDNGTLNDLERITGSAGIPAVFFLDEGEENDYSTPTVWCNLQYLGTDMAYKCSPGKVFIIGGDTESESAKQIEAGLLYDGQYGLYRNENTLVEYVSFAGKGRTMQETIELELDQNQDIGMI